jgi:multidrug resistance efflux pump
MADRRPISTPWSQRWRRIRHRVVPLVVFGTAAVTVSLLWNKQGHYQKSVGVVEVVLYEMTAPVSGMLVADGVRKWELFDTVAPDDVVARLDDTLLQRQIATQRAQIARLEARIAEEEARFEEDLAEANLQRADLEYEGQVDARRLAIDIERLRLAVMDRKAQIAADKIELDRQGKRLAEIEKLADRGVETPWAHWNAEMRHGMVKERLKVSQSALTEAEKQLAQAEERQRTARWTLRNMPRVELAGREAQIRPLRADIQIQNAQIQELEAQIAAMVIRSPVKGTISRIDFRPGQPVVAGQPILAITAEQEQKHIISYIRESQSVRPTKGMSVDIRDRSFSRRWAGGKIIEVGPNVELVPRHHRRDPQMREWGWPVRIELVRMEKDFHAQPGALVEVMLHARR